MYNYYISIKNNIINFFKGALIHMVQLSSRKIQVFLSQSKEVTYLPFRCVKNYFSCVFKLTSQSESG
jgi:hypothetical protein